MDITQLILDDHYEQRRLFAILEQVATRNRVTAGEVWSRLAACLELHAAAEEQIFYPALIRAGLRSGHARDVEGETLDAIKDHNEIRDTVAETVRHDVGTPGWRQAIARALDMCSSTPSLHPAAVASWYSELRGRPAARSEAKRPPRSRDPTGQVPAPVLKERVFCESRS